MSDDIEYCPSCAERVDVLGLDVEDRYVCDCPTCGIVEIVYYDYKYHDTTAFREGWIP